jgi:hypothetical protein
MKAQLVISVLQLLLANCESDISLQYIKHPVILGIIKHSEEKNPGA